MDTQRKVDPLAGIDWAEIDRQSERVADLPDMETLRRMSMLKQPQGNPAATKSINSLHNRRKAEVDVYGDGEWVVTYRASRLQDPDVASEFETLTERVNGAGNSAQASDLVALRDLVARWLLKLVYAWNLSDPITFESMCDLGLEMMMDVVNAIRNKENTKN